MSVRLILLALIAVTVGCNRARLTVADYNGDESALVAPGAGDGAAPAQALGDDQSPLLQQIPQGPSRDHAIFVHSYSSLFLWLDASSPQGWFNGNDTAEYRLGEWTDLSDHNRNFSLDDNDVLSGGEEAPLFELNSGNGLPGVYFYGENEASGPHMTGQFMTRDVEDDVSDMTVFLVVTPEMMPQRQWVSIFHTRHQPQTASQYDGASLDSFQIDFNGAAGEQGVGVLRFRTQCEYMFDIGAAQASTMVVSATINQMSPSGEVLDRPTVRTYLNGREGSYGQPERPLVLRDIGLGSNRLNNRFYRGHIHEVIVYKAFLGNNMRNSLEDYLKSKWNVDDSQTTVVPEGQTSDLSPCVNLHYYN